MQPKGTMHQSHASCTIMVSLNKQDIADSKILGVLFKLTQDLFQMTLARAHLTSSQSLQLECISTETKTQCIEILQYLQSFSTILEWSVKPKIVSNLNASEYKPEKKEQKKNEIDDNEIKLIEAGERSQTTIMLRNIPNKYTPKMLQNFVNKTHKVSFV